jgi:hypothetical protein
MQMYTDKSTSRRQGRLREEGSEGSRSANVRDDGQKPHTRFSSWASRHNTSEAHRFGSRINAAFVHGKFTFLSGEICASRDRRHMRLLPEWSNRLTNDQAYSAAVGGYESLWETQIIQQLMSNPVAPVVETRRVSTQKSAEGIVLPTLWKKGPNAEKRMTLSCALIR